MINLVDLEVIDRFKEFISWADETQLIQWHGRTLMKTDLAVWVPSKWDEVDYSLLAAVKNEFSIRVIALVYGDPTDSEVIRLYQECIREGFCADFIDIKAKLAWGHFVMQALDGVDWGRTIQGCIEEGFEAKPVYEWD